MHRKNGEAECGSREHFGLSYSEREEWKRENSPLLTYYFLVVLLRNLSVHCSLTRLPVVDGMMASQKIRPRPNPWNLQTQSYLGKGSLQKCRYNVKVR